MSKMVVFLGNPGVQYKNTRHNTARQFCDFLNLQGTWSEKFNSKILKKGNTLYLIPDTYMNVSGIPVQQAASYFNVEPESILVVHDDIELKFGEVRKQLGGGMGGHNGLRSVKQQLGTDAFSRLRIGIGRPAENMEVASFVLARFSKVEENSMCDIFSKAETLLEKFNEE